MQVPAGWDADSRIDLNSLMSANTHVPGHTPPNTGSCTAASELSAPSSDPHCPTPRQRVMRSVDSQELLFCLLPQAIPKQWELNIYKAVTVCLMFNLVLGSLMLRIAEVTVDYTTGGVRCTRVPDSNQEGMSPLRGSAEVASCLVLCPRALKIP